MSAPFSLNPNAAPAADGADPVREGTDKGFMADVIEASKTQPVIVDFWAPWCGPCRQLGPPLEKAVRAAKGKVRLVKINIDENPAVAGQLGVRSIPAVYAFDKGRPVDGFMGVIPESQIKVFVDRLQGDTHDHEVDDLLAMAAESLSLGDIGGAAQAYAHALQHDPESLKAIAGLARCYLAGGDVERAREALDFAPPDKAGDPELASVRAAIELASAPPPPADETAKLAAAVAAAPNDRAARFELANALSAAGKMDEAVDHLLTIVEQERDWNEGAARAQVLKIFEAAGPLSEIAKSGRRRLSSILFS